ncbi:P1 family peptidase [Bacillus sp. SB49]|uniref:P1 family peptidase n=1 Tax=Bacillus sp. SB49 TaxID=1071080 RepID=UPI000414E3C9|nr:P1 family peptidase [Bacillus sp. SB49]QHT46798.1 P1 family peptidase [Bacillus sp. SB49]
MKEIDIRNVSDFFIGQTEDNTGTTGCTVILSKEGAVAGVDVRGGAPGTRETDLMRSENMVQKVHGLFLAGGSAYGLSAGSGVMQWLEEHHIGFETGPVKVPIVPGAILYDIDPSRPAVRPDAAMGYEAARIAWENPPFSNGRYGAGTGATVGKLFGRENSMKGGIGSYAFQSGKVKVGAVIAVNCFGDVVDPGTGRVVAGLHKNGEFLRTETHLMNNVSTVPVTDSFQGNTTIGVLLTNASLHKSEANKLASISHNGLARTIRPSHTYVDGDTLFTMHGDEVACDVNGLGAMAAFAVEKAVLRAFEH